MINECDNISACHDAMVIAEDLNALRVICKNCKAMAVIRKDPFKDVPENRAWSKFFKRWVLQGNDNLFYKYNAQFLSQ